MISPYTLLSAQEVIDRRTLSVRYKAPTNAQELLKEVLERISSKDFYSTFLIRAKRRNYAIEIAGRSLYVFIDPDDFSECLDVLKQLGYSIYEEKPGKLAYVSLPQ